MIQSYGLVPPNMTRRQFEYAFTPLKPSGISGNIRVGSRPTGVTPVDLFTKASLQREREKRRRTVGAWNHLRAWYRSIWTKTLLGRGGDYVSTVIKVQMPWILAAFKNQSQKPGYGFMKAYRPVSGGAYDPRTRKKWSNCYTQLEDGTILAKYANYFKEGNTILAGVNTRCPPTWELTHWVVIVNDKETTFTTFITRRRRKRPYQKKYHLYPADDPLGYQIYVMVPWAFKRVRNKLKVEFPTLTTTNTDQITYKGKKVRMLVKKTAYKRLT
jgi:hypothetical protein